MNALVIVDSPAPGSQSRNVPQRIRRLWRRLGYYRRTGRLGDAVAWQIHLRIAAGAGRHLGSSSARRAASVRKAHADALAAYRGAEVNGDVVLVISEQSATTEDDTWRDQWQSLVDGVLRVATIPGAHAALTDSGPARRLAGVIEAAIVEDDTRTAGPPGNITSAGGRDRMIPDC